VSAEIRRGLEIHRSAGRFPVPCSPGSPLGDVRLPLATRQAGVSNETSFATASDEDQPPGPVASRRLLCHDTVRLASFASRHAARRRQGTSPRVLTEAPCYELPADVACGGCRRGQRQSGFSPETPAISRQMPGIGSITIAPQKQPICRDIHRTRLQRRRIASPRASTVSTRRSSRSSHRYCLPASMCRCFFALSRVLCGRWSRATTSRRRRSPPGAWSHSGACRSIRARRTTGHSRPPSTWKRTSPSSSSRWCRRPGTTRLVWMHIGSACRRRSDQQLWPWRPSTYVLLR
jgi:hypothetical protein